MSQATIAFALILVVALKQGFGDTSPSSSTKDFAAALQEQTDAVVAHFQQSFPGLTISVAWRDASNDVAVASGNVSGRKASTQDTFLYGSGTKPVTATGVLRLIDAGILKGSDKVSDIIDPYLVAHGQPKLSDFFGAAVSNATVLELIRMGAGIRDFEDSFDFDKWVLGNGSKFWNFPYDAMTFAASADNIGSDDGPSLYCEPGTCTAYSSTSYEVAGLVLAAVLAPASPWYDFDLGSAVFDNRSDYPSVSFPPKGNSTMNLSHFLTVPGYSTASTWQKATIYEQNPTILGWTCGNLVASPRDMAKFVYHLLDIDAAHGDEKPLLSDASREQMTDFQLLSKGWMAGRLRYGAGMMEFAYGSRTKRIMVQAHEGDTYGFLSTQAYVPTLKGAFSVATNVDNDYPLETMVCYLLQIVEEKIGGSSESFGCTPMVRSSSTILV